MADASQEIGQRPAHRPAGCSGRAGGRRRGSAGIRRRDQVGGFAHQIGRGGAVIGAGDAQRGQAQGWRWWCRNRCPRWRRRSRTSLRGLVGTAAGAQGGQRRGGVPVAAQPALHRAVGDGGRPPSADGGDAGLPLRGGADAGGGVRQDQPAHQVQPFDGQALRDHAAKRDAEHDGIFQARSGRSRVRRRGSARPWRRARGARRLAPWPRRSSRRMRWRGRQGDQIGPQRQRCQGRESAPGRAAGGAVQRGVQAEVWQEISGMFDK